MFDEEISNFLKALSNKNRQKILFLFADGEKRTVNEVAEGLQLGQSTTSEHLSLMKNAGLLLSSKEGREVYYLPDRRRIIRVLEEMAEALKTCC